MPRARYVAWNWPDLEPCPGRGHTTGTWVLLWHLAGQPARGALFRDGVPISTAVIRYGRLENVDMEVVAACEERVVPGNYRVEAYVGGQTLVREFTVRP